MPLDASGNASRLSGSIVVPGAKILAARYNADLNDIYQAQSLAVYHDGRRAMSGDLSFNPGKTAILGKDGDGDEAARAIQIRRYASRSFVATRNLAALPMGAVIKVDGYAAAGDGGHGAYRKVAAMPLHAGRVQTTDGSWFELISYWKPENFGAFPNISHVTDQMRDAMAASLIADRPLFFAPDTYLVQNMEILYDTSWDVLPSPLGRKQIRLMGIQGTIIRAVAGGDDLYLCAGFRWVNNAGFGQGPWQAENIIFDAANIKQNACINVSWGCVFQNCRWVNGLRHGLWDTSTQKNGARIVGARVGNRFISCKMHDNADTGWRIDDNGLDFYTDWFVRDIECYDNGINFDWQQYAGFKYSQLHSWNHAKPPKAGATASNIFRNGYSAISGGENILEGYDGKLPGFPTKTYCLQLISAGQASVSIGMCSFLLGRGVLAELTGGTAAILLHGCTYNGNPADGDDCALWHGTNLSTARIYSSNSTFTTSNPYRFTAGAAHVGQIITNGDILLGLNRTSTGLVRPDYGTQTGVAPAGTVAKTVGQNVLATDPETVFVFGSLTVNTDMSLPATPFVGQTYIIARFAGNTGGPWSLQIKAAGAGPYVVFLLANKSARITWDGVAWRSSQISDCQS